MMSQTKLPKEVVLKTIEEWIQENRVVELQNRQLALTRLQNRGTAFEDRFLEDEYVEAPDYLRFSKTPHRFGYLTDGRRVQLLGTTRVRTLCGVSEVLEVASHDVMTEPIAVGALCHYCGGTHLHLAQPRVTVPHAVPSVSTTPEVLCGHCHEKTVAMSQFQNHFALSCWKCGWFFEALVDRLGQIKGQHEVVQWSEEHHTSEMEHMPVAWETEVSVLDSRDDEECVEMPCEDEGVLMEMCEEDASEALDDDMAHLMDNFTKLWSQSSWKSLRNQLLTETIIGTISRESVDMIWMVVASLLDSCRGLSRQEEKQFIEELCQLSRHDLIALVPEFSVHEEEAEPIMPIVQMKLKKWVQGCQRKVARFRVKQAGIRMLAPKIGVSSEVLAAVCL